MDYKDLDERTKMLLEDTEELASNLNALKGCSLNALEDDHVDFINNFVKGLDKEGAEEFLEKSKNVKNQDAKDFVETLLKNKI